MYYIDVSLGTYTFDKETGIMFIVVVLFNPDAVLRAFMCTKTIAIKCMR